MARDRQVIFQDIRLPRKSSCKRHTHNKKQRNRCSSQCLLRNGDGNTRPALSFLQAHTGKRKDSKCASSRAYIFQLQPQCAQLYLARIPLPERSALQILVHVFVYPAHHGIQSFPAHYRVLRQRDTRRGSSYSIGNSYNPESRFKECR